MTHKEKVTAAMSKNFNQVMMNNYGIECEFKFATKAETQCWRLDPTPLFHACLLNASKTLSFDDNNIIEVHTSLVVTDFAMQQKEMHIGIFNFDAATGEYVGMRHARYRDCGMFRIEESLFNKKVDNAA
jgi:hypothetical protein